MGIPYGTRYTATVRGSTLKEVECENCTTVFYYQVERESSASGTSVLWLDNQGAKDRASQAAQTDLQEKLGKAVDPVACPICGWFQANMCKLLGRRRLYIALGISLPIAVILLIWGLIIRNEPGGNSTTLIAISLCIGAVGILAGFTWSLTHNPNRAHPGRGGTNPKAASGSKGVSRADVESASAKAREEWEGNFHRYLLQSMMQMSAANGSIDESELKRVSDIYLRVTGDELPTDRLRREAEDVAAKREELLRNLNQFSASLTDEAKDLYIRAGVAVAAADGDFEQSEWELLLQVGQALKISQQRFEAVLAALKAE